MAAAVVLGAHLQPLAGDDPEGLCLRVLDRSPVNAGIYAISQESPRLVPFFASTLQRYIGVVIEQLLGVGPSAWR